MVITKRQRNWIIYSLPERRADELQRNLKCLQDCVQTEPAFERDLARLSKLVKKCCEPRGVFARSAIGGKRNAKNQGSVHLRP